jgi:hypothetical protein
MTYYGFIDESGTMPKDKIMTIALVILHGKHAADKVHFHVAKLLYPNPKIKGRARLEHWYDKQKLHYADMSAIDKLTVGESLAKVSIKAYVASTRHTNMSKTHSFRFQLYKELVKSTINAALADFEDLVINIGRQGGSQKYGSDLIKELQILQNENNRQIRKNKIFLLSASNAGIQLADFYASASRDYILSKSTAISATPYAKVCHQITQLPELEITPILKEG